MKQSNFWIKLLSFLLVNGFFLYYQSIAGARAEALAENEAAIAEIEAYNREIERENEVILRAAEGADAMDAEQEAETGPFADGVYEGEGMGYGGVIRVEVTVTNGFIERIDVVEHSSEDPAYYMLAETLVDEILLEQGADIDAAAGATFSSAGLKQAVSAALEQAARS